MKPTDEQLRCVELFQTGEGLAIEAGAGTGKTSTLVLLAEAAGRKRGQYLAFNRALVEDGRGRFPTEVSLNTAHSLAFRAVGRDYKHRLDLGLRLTQREVAAKLGIAPLDVRDFADQPKHLSPGFLAGLVSRAVASFCQSDAPYLSTQHVPYVEGLDPVTDGVRSFKNNALVREHVLPYAKAVWEDLGQRHGWAPYKHDHYLKQWQLSGPRIEADYILFDEAQDANPVIAAIVAAQTHAQRVYVGDSCQPAGTKVKVVCRAGAGRRQTETVEVPIEDLRVGDRVVSYDISRSHMHGRGKLVTGISSRPFSGDLVRVDILSTGESSAYTPDHRVVVKMGDLLDGHQVVYLMRRGNQYRIGRCEWRYGSQHRASGPYLRCLHEKADAFWVLDAFDSVETAALAEVLAGLDYGIPTMTFEPTNHRLDTQAFWTAIGDNTERADRCLRECGRMIGHPLWQAGGPNLLQRRAFVTRASNVMDGMQVMTADGVWRVAVAKRERHYGLVYSMDVEDDHTYIGDGVVTHNCQQIYEWTGAIDALARVDVPNRAFLSQSFRFGPAVADAANIVLERIPGAELRLTGNPAIASRVEPVALPRAILTRTNAEGLSTLLHLQDIGRSAHLLGGSADLAGFARGADDLMYRGSTGYPQLAAFDSWESVRRYAEEDEEGADLRLLVKLVDTFGTQVIVDALDRMPSEKDAEITISTAHKSKGRQWDSVRLATDFPDMDGRVDLKTGKVKPAAAPDLRLLYVAVTRAQNVLDASAIPALRGSDLTDDPRED